MKFSGAGVQGKVPCQGLGELSLTLPQEYGEGESTAKSAKWRREKRCF